jgi:hypothetical protein
MQRGRKLISWLAVRHPQGGPLHGSDINRPRAENGIYKV